MVKLVSRKSILNIHIHLDEVTEMIHSCVLICQYL